MQATPDSACEKVFWRDPYRTRLQTRISAVDGERVTLEQTIFFASSGGQESDDGTIGGVCVLDARTAGEGIVYTLPRDHGLRREQTVEIVIDWTRRYRLMRLHLAAEIVLELALRELAPIEKIGAHIGPDRARIDFARATSLAGELLRIQARAMQLIEADHKVVSTFSDERTGRRYWQIDGFARVPCGGTHLRRTGEIGALTLRRRNPGRGKERIEITLSEP